MQNMNANFLGGMSITLLRAWLLTMAVALPAQAVDFTLSGFGTAGYAQSDNAANYQRFINDNGTFKRDSILGAQLDARFSPEWGATIQAKVAPSDHSDSDYQASMAWAFVSWRPADDWLIRAGKIRLPLMLNTENNDVGATFDFARLPQEVYSISPMTDIVGLGLSKTWVGDSVDWILEAYTGTAKTQWRFYNRDSSVDRPQAGSWFLPINITSTGMVLTARSLDNVFRIGFHEVEASRDGAKIGAPIISTPIGGGYVAYSVGSGGSDKVTVPVFTLGASALLPADIRMTGEYAKISVDSVTEGLSRWGAYLALSRRFGAWTPYAYIARMKSTDSSIEKYKRINGNTLPSVALTNQQKFLADVVAPYDQATVAVGASYRLTPTSLIKAEISQVRTGDVSSFIDAPSGGDSAHKRLDVFSLSYSFIF
ncbi:MAG: hypothetical protein IPJ12_15500 [Betaproteobacteria bacterium]|nr:hypothetical protein [Betaproteobacteria bacterium]